MELLRHLATKPGHDEVKADFRDLLVKEFGADLNALDFERRVPEVRGRLDALIGRTILEAKSDLGREWPDVERRMPDYLADREREEGERFVGIATDGKLWKACELTEVATLVVVSSIVLDPEKPGLFLAWLDGVVALKASLPPDPHTIRIELGQNSFAFRRPNASLTALWARLAIHLKKQLWSDLLKLVYGRDIDSEALWFQHTFLVVVAKCIALAVLHIREDDPRRLLSGEAFGDAGIFGAVESDFFDWIVEDADGEALVRRIMAHVRRFRLAEVASDVLKILYESLIDRDERHGLGEYYTPDWLAAKIVKRVVARPLVERVLDPACGSGTFLFHAIRLLIVEAYESGMKPELIASEGCARVAGTDIHPVAVIIARVTYLLALTPALARRQGSLSVPVYLGDAMQLSISQVMAGKELTIRVPPPRAGDEHRGEKNESGREQLDFPDTFCREPTLFDKAIERMRRGSEDGNSREQVERALIEITKRFYKSEITQEQDLAIKDLGRTYVTMDRLRKEGRDSVWSYVARNLSRPLALSSGVGWASILIGNPPWVAYRHMSTDLQRRFKDLAKEQLVYVGGKLTTQNDLCALFTVRATLLYLRASGQIAFILPLSVLTRGQFERLRSGSFSDVRIAWNEVWTMDDRLQPLFPVPACVIFGERRRTSKPLPVTVRRYTGTLPYRDAPEDVAEPFLQVTENAPALAVTMSQGGSTYRKSFRNGATLFPRMLCFVERKSSGRLGSDANAPIVVSRRTSSEKLPWRDLPGLEGRVEREFLKPVLLGESIAPFRLLKRFEAVIPVTSSGAMLDASSAQGRGFDDLSRWLRKAEEIWRRRNKDQKLSISERWNYHGELTAQFPQKQLQIVYAASGMNPAACVLEGDFIIEHKLYWYATTCRREADFLSAILNSETVRSRSVEHQSRGQWGSARF